MVPPSVRGPCRTRHPRGRADLPAAADRPVDLPRPCRRAARPGQALGAPQPRRCAVPRDRTRARRELRRPRGPQGLAAAAPRGRRDRPARTVERLMRAMGLRGAVRGRAVKTTVQNPALPCPLDRVNRQFHAPAPDRLWVSDFTYVATWQGFAHVAFVIDAYARRIAGRARQSHRHGGLRGGRARSGDPPAPAHEGRGARRTLGSRVAISCPSVHRAPGRGRHRALGGLDRPTATTTHWPRPSSGSSRPRSSGAAARGAASRPWSSPPLSGSIGSTTAGSSNRSDTSRPPRPRSATTSS